MALEGRENRAGMRAFLASPEMVAAMRTMVDAGKRRAEQISPVRTGHYRSSFYTESGVRNGVAYGRLGNTAEYALFLERGTYKMEPQRIIGRALDVMPTVTVQQFKAGAHTVTQTLTQYEYHRED